MQTVDCTQIASFEHYARAWWDPEGAFKPLHKINPVRLSYIFQMCQQHYHLKGTMLPNQLKILDVGCGGGLVAESLARLGATVTGIDAGSEAIIAAKLHASDNNCLNLNYLNCPIELLPLDAGDFDVVLALEIVEHVSDVEIFIKSLAGRLKPGGLIILSTLNRTIASYTLGILAAEYLLKWVPKGTHTWSRFLQPAELASYLRQEKLIIQDVTGLSFNIFKQSWHLSQNFKINYFLSASSA